MADTKKIVILGTGGSSIDILDTIQDINARNATLAYKCDGFLDDNKSLWGRELHGGVKVLGPLSGASKLSDCLFVNGIGTVTNFRHKESIISSTGVSLEKFATLVHPSASVSRSAKLGRGVVVFQNATITSNVNIGNHVIILPNSVISHDDIVGDFTCITGGVCISGGVRVGSSCYLGTNSSIIGNITIGDGSLIGMGSVVLQDVPSNSVFIGSPAKYRRQTISL